MTNSSWPRSRSSSASRRRPAISASLDRGHVVVLDPPRPRLDVRAVDRQRGERVGEAGLVEQRAQAGDLARERRRGLLDLGLQRDLGERPRLARQLGEEVGQLGLAGRVDEQRRRVVEELVADGALDRPVAQGLAGVEDLLHPDVLRAGVGQAAQVAGRVGEAVGMVDPQAGDHAVAHELEDLPVGHGEDLGILDPHRGEVVDVEEAPVPAVLRVPVEELRAQLLVGPPAVLVRDPHVVGDDVEHDLEARARAAPAGRPRRRARPTRASGRRRRSRASSRAAPAARARGTGARCRGRAGTGRARRPRRSRARG